MARTSVLTENEYGAQEYDAVLVRENVVVCVEASTDEVRLHPLGSVISIDGSGADLLTEREIPDSFYGGGQTGFVDLGAFESVRQHLEELEGETY